MSSVYPTLPVDIPRRGMDPSRLALQVWTFKLKHGTWPAKIQVVFHDPVIYQRWVDADLIPAFVDLQVGPTDLSLPVAVVMDGIKGSPTSVCYLAA